MSMAIDNDAMAVAVKQSSQSSLETVNSDESHVVDIQNTCSNDVTSSELGQQVLSVMDLNNCHADMDVINEEVVITDGEKENAEASSIAEQQPVFDPVDKELPVPVMSHDNLDVVEEVVVSSTSASSLVSPEINHVTTATALQTVDIIQNALHSAEICTNDVNAAQSVAKSNNFNAANEISSYLSNENAGKTIPESISNTLTRTTIPQDNSIKSNHLTSKVVFKDSSSQQVKLLLNRNSQQVGLPSRPSIRLIPSSKGGPTTYVINPRDKSNNLSPSSVFNANNFHLPVYNLGDGNTLEIGPRRKVVLLNNNENASKKSTAESETSQPEQNATQAPKVIRKKKEEEKIPDFLSIELKQGFKILRDLMSEKAKNINWPFLDAVNSNWPEVADYKDVIKNPMWLRRIRENFLEQKYTDMKEPIADIRLMLENCYKYNGPDHPITKKALKLETIMEQKLALLPKELREKTKLETSVEELEEVIVGGQKRRAYRTLADGGSSLLLSRVKHEKALREKEIRRKQMEEKKAEKEAAYQKAIEWENILLNEDNIREMKAMWELPQIGHFLYLTQSTLNIPEISQFELERILLMPRQSNVLQIIMTSLLANPNGRTNLDKRPPMKYRIWTEKLKLRLIKWYRLLRSKCNQPVAVFEHFGIEPAFFSVMGFQNPMEEKQFHELTFHQRIWLLKSLCDYCLHTHKTIQEIISEQNLVDQKEVCLGSDMNGYVYIHFPQFCGQDLRIYRQAGWIPPSIDIPVLNSRCQSKAPITRLERKAPEPVPKKVVKGPAGDSSPNTPYQRPSNLRQHLKRVQRDDMICEGIGNKPVEPDINLKDDPDFDPSNINMPVDVSNEDVDVTESDTKPAGQNQSKSPLKDDEKPQSPVAQTDLSKSIMDFDLEKELAISIRGRCGRKSKRISERKKKDEEAANDDDSVKLDDDDIKVEEPECEEAVGDETPISDEIKKEEESDDEVEMKENESDEETDVEVKGSVKTEVDDNDEVSNFELDVYEYLNASRYDTPNLKNFELIVDGLDSLKDLVDKLINEEDLPAKESGRGRTKGPRMTRAQRNELELKKRLCNLLEELEPWKEKLNVAVKKTLQRMKKEWDDYDPKTEEDTGQDVWESESDEEKSQVDQQPPSEDEDLNDDNGEEFQRIRTRYLKALKKKEKKKAEQGEEFSVVVSSRGRVRKVRTHKKDDIYDYGDDEDGAQKDSDKSDTFTPECSRKRKKESEGADSTGLKTPKKIESADEESKKQIIYTLGSDGVLKHVDVRQANGKKISRSTKRPRKSPQQVDPSKANDSSNLAGIVGGGNKVIKIGNQTIVAPNGSGMKTISVGGKTVLVHNSNIHQNPNQNSSISSKSGDGGAASSKNEIQVVQLHNANGSLQKIISLSHAQKLLSASRKSPISSQKGVVTKPDGSILVPVVDDQGKVLYLKMKKNTSTSSENAAQKAAGEGTASNQSSPIKASISPSNPKKSNILRSIIQSSVGEIGTAGKNSPPNHLTIRKMKAETKNVTISPSNQVAGSSVLGTVQPGEQSNLIRVVNSEGKNILMRVPNSGQNIAKIISAPGSAPRLVSTTARPVQSLSSVISQSNVASIVMSNPGQVITVPSPAPTKKKITIHSSIEKQLKAGQGPSKLKNISPKAQVLNVANVTQKELTDAVSSLKDQTFVESNQIPKALEAESAAVSQPSVQSPQPKVVTTTANKGMRVIVNKGGHMMPMTLSGEQLAGLSAGGSYVLNIKSGKLVPVSTAALAQKATVSSTTASNVPQP